MEQLLNHFFPGYLPPSGGRGKFLGSLMCISHCRCRFLWCIYASLFASSLCDMLVQDHCEILEEFLHSDQDKEDTAWSLFAICILSKVVVSV